MHFGVNIHINHTSRLTDNLVLPLRSLCPCSPITGTLAEYIRYHYRPVDSTPPNTRVRVLETYIYALLDTFLKNLLIQAHIYNCSGLK